MFYRLPFPDHSRMEKVHKLAGVTGDVAIFLNEMQADLDNGMGDLRTGWEAYLDTHAANDAGATAPPNKTSLSKRRARNKTPPMEVDEGEVCNDCYPRWHICTCTS